MSNVPDITQEQLQQASRAMASMSPEDMARTAEMAQRAQPGASAGRPCSVVQQAYGAGRPLIQGDGDQQLSCLGAMCHAQHPSCCFPRRPQHVLLRLLRKSSRSRATLRLAGMP